MELQPGTPLQGGKYQIISRLGQGGFGITYLANHNMLNKHVCIKEFFPKSFYNRDSNTRTITLGSEGSREMMDAYRKKFIKEARTISNFNHRNIITIHDVFEENNTAYYVMDYIDGCSLWELIKRNGPLPTERAKDIMHHVASALDYVHKRNTLHLDIKPANIMICNSDNRVVLIDFGISKEIDENGHILTSTPIGISPLYAPLEQQEQSMTACLTPATDIYSLAATLFSATTGELPPMTSDILCGKLDEMTANLSPEIRQAILQSMTPKANARPQSAGAFMSILYPERVVKVGGTGSTNTNSSTTDSKTTISRPVVSKQPTHTITTQSETLSTPKATSASTINTSNKKLMIILGIIVGLGVIIGGIWWYNGSYNKVIEAEIEVFNRLCPLVLDDYSMEITEAYIERNGRSVVSLRYTAYDSRSNYLDREIERLQLQVQGFDDSVEGVSTLYYAEGSSCLMELVYEEGWTIENVYYDEDGEYLFTTEISPGSYAEWAMSSGYYGSVDYEPDYYYDEDYSIPNVIE